MNESEFITANDVWLNIVCLIRPYVALFFSMARSPTKTSRVMPPPLLLKNHDENWVVRRPGLALLLYVFMSAVCKLGNYFLVV